MTPVYEVKTKHTKKVLEDFIKFSFKLKNPAMTAMIVVFAMCFYTLALIARDRTVPLVVCAVLGTIVLIFAFSRKKIAFSKLAANDPNYQKQSEIHFVFGEKEFTIDDGEAEGLQHVKYGEIAFIYTDKVYYYVSVNNEMLHLLPKTDFVTGTAEGFYKFITDKTKQEIRPVYIPWKIRFRLMMEYRDLQAEAMKKEQEEKRKKKKKK